MTQCHQSSWARRAAQGRERERETDCEVFARKIDNEKEKRGKYDNGSDNISIEMSELKNGWDHGGE